MTIKIIDFPFSFSKSADGAYIASVGATSDFKKIWQHRVLLVLATRPGERVMRPDFGSNLYRVLFESEVSAGEIANEAIAEAFVKWLPDLELRQVTPSFSPSTGLLTVNIIYGLPNGEPDSVTINTGVFNRSGDLIQEITNG
jgi:hypothetical protein